MRILYIHQYFCTRQGRAGTRSYEFAKYLVRRGHRVTMLTSASEISDVDIPAGRSTHRLRIDGIDVIAVRVGYSQNMSPLRRITSFLHFMLISSWHACRARGHDVVFATSTPLTVGIPGVLASWALRVPFVFEVRDLWPEAPIQMGVVRNRLVIRLLRALERFLYRCSTHVVALSPGMRDGVLDAGTPESKIRVIPNCSDLDLFQPGAAPEHLLQRYDLQGRFVVLHAGSMGAANGLDVLVDAAVRLHRDGVDDVRFVLLGQGSTSGSMQGRIRDEGLTNIVLPGSIPRAQVADFVRASDVCLVLFRALPVLATNSPNKLFDALAGGRPVVVNSDGWTRRLVEDHEVGRFATPGSGDALAREILWLKENHVARERMGRQARALAEREFDRIELAASLERVLESAVRRRAGGEPATRLAAARPLPPEPSPAAPESSPGERPAPVGAVPAAPGTFAPE